MSIILRTNKGSALTYDEMDRNQSQFFYSSSISPDGTKLRLHYTGSDTLDLPGEDYGPTRYQEILFPNIDLEVPEAAAAGNNTQIQFNDNGVFGADPLFVFEKIKNTVGIGTANPIDRLDIAGAASQTATISLRGYTAGTGNQKQSKINFYEGSTFLGRLGRTDGDNQNIYLTNNYNISGGAGRGTTFGKVHISIGADGDDDAIVAATFTRNSNVSKLGVGTKDPNRAGTFVGSTGIGISPTSANTEQSFITPIPTGNAPNGIYGIVNENGTRKLVPNNSDSSGLLIASPNDVNGGNIVVAINTDTTNKNEGFNIINAYEGVYTNSEVIASFQASGKVGINTNYPSDVGLTVAGNISGSGTLQVGTIAAATATGTNKTLVTDSNGLVNYLPAAPVPFGGIIMWSGNTNAVPEGWVLCNVGGIVTTGLGSRFVPDLTNKFIIGWNGDEDANGPKTDITTTDPGDPQLTVQGGNKNAVLVAHEHTLTINQGNHGHPFRVSHESGGAPDASGFPRLDLSAPFATHAANTGDPSNMATNGTGNAIGGAKANILATSKADKKGLNAAGANNASQTGVNANLPPYYALAFIMYVGV